MADDSDEETVSF